MQYIPKTIKENLYSFHSINPLHVGILICISNWILL